MKFKIGDIVQSDYYYNFGIIYDCYLIVDIIKIDGYSYPYYYECYSFQNKMKHKFFDGNLKLVENIQ